VNPILKPCGPYRNDVLIINPYSFRPAYRDLILSDGAVGYWRLGEASGTTAEDETGSYPGTYVGSPTLGVAGAISDGSTAVQFDGSTQRVTIPYNSALAPTGAITLELFANANWGSITGSPALISKTAAGGWNFRVNDGVTGAGFLGFIVNSSGYFGARVSLASLPAGFSHIVGTFDGRYLKLYINAVLVDTVDRGSTGAISYTAANALIIAGEASSGADWEGSGFPGSLDEVAIYPTALSAAQVLAHYNAR